MHCDARIERVAKWVFNECLPPVVRDSRVFMQPLLRVVFGEKAKYFLHFHEAGGPDTNDQLDRAYNQTRNVKVQQQGSDLSDAALERICSATVGNRVLDVGGGNGVLAESLRSDHKVTVCDLLLDEDVVGNFRT
jgi:hypothetical protein